MHHPQRAPFCDGCLPYGEEFLILFGCKVICMPVFAAAEAGGAVRFVLFMGILAVSGLREIIVKLEQKEKEKTTWTTQKNN